MDKDSRQINEAYENLGPGGQGFGSLMPIYYMVIMHGAGHPYGDFFGKDTFYPNQDEGEFDLVEAEPIMVEHRQGVFMAVDEASSDFHRNIEGVEFTPVMDGVWAHTPNQWDHTMVFDARKKDQIIAWMEGNVMIGSGHVWPEVIDHYMSAQFE